MKSIKKVLLPKDSILSSKNFSPTKLHQSFYCNDDFSSANTTQTFIDRKFYKTLKYRCLKFQNLGNNIKIVTINTQKTNNLKYKLTIKKRDTSSIGITKNVNYSNYIPSVFRKNASMGEDIFIN